MSNALDVDLVTTLEKVAEQLRRIADVMVEQDMRHQANVAKYAESEAREQQTAAELRTFMENTARHNAEQDRRQLEHQEKCDQWHRMMATRAQTGQPS